MKKKHPIRTLLGITQQDISMILGINRSTWGMFEIGKRDLPFENWQLLNEIVVHVQKTDPIESKEQSAHANEIHLNRLLRENKYAQMLTAKKIAAATRKIETQPRLLRLAAFLKERKDGRRVFPGLTDYLTLKATGAPEAAFSELLFHEQHRLDVLMLEKSLLESKLKSIQANANAEEKK